MTKNIYDNEEISLDNNEEIDWKNIASTLLRSKKFISIFTFISVILSILYSYTTKKIWEGEFQIVLDSESQDSLLSSFNQPIAIPIFDVEDPLDTQVGILQSPLVLSKVFEFVKSEKSESNPKISSLKFRDWKKNSLDIELEKGTSILNISYRDNEKSLILPVLKRISSSYQDYSGKARSREIELSKNFFEDQINIFRKRSIDSLRKAQIFATEQDITIPSPQGFASGAAILSGGTGFFNEIPNTVDIESIRVQSANEIRNIDIQLSELSKLDDPDSIIYFARSIQELVAAGLEGLPQKLEEINTDLALSKLVYQEDDEMIAKLKKDREVLISLLKNKSRSFLEARKTVAEAKLKAAERPEGVLIKYRQLIGDANKDKKTLESLEVEYRGILLEEARITDPWELITSPNLLTNPVSPQKTKIVLATLLASFLTSSLLSILLESKKNIIFSANDIRSIFNWRTLSEISLDDQELFRKSLIYILESDLNYENNNIDILLIGDFEDKLISNIKDISKEIKLNKFKVINNIFNLSDSSEVITITGLEISKKDKCIEAAQKLQIKKKKVLGNIILKDFNYPVESGDELELVINNFGLILNNLKNDLKYIYDKYSWKYFKNKIIYYSKLLKKNFK